MPKELPYFKFEPLEWDNGNIQMCNYESKGVFIELCSMYWARGGELPYALALQKLCNGNANLMQGLEKHEIFVVQEGQIIIEFLDEQLNHFQETSIKRRDAANKRWNNANAMQLQSKSNAIREDKRREEEIREKNKDLTEFEKFWNAYDHKIGKEKCQRKWGKLSKSVKEQIMDYVPKYVDATPNKQYRKHPSTFLNNKSWEDELPAKKTNALTPDQHREAILKSSKPFS